MMDRGRGRRDEYEFLDFFLLPQLFLPPAVSSRDFPLSLSPPPLFPIPSSHGRSGKLLSSREKWGGIGGRKEVVGLWSFFFWAFVGEEFS